ncbi:MAG TPA: type II toxin-antitoxin system Phd/YefM family antitoxin [Candidatus Gallimonas gallistercoris]|uniref:Antitoxin n=1 Tax=Candidatus Gallimonas gallistercoris TaxID=2838602 RepID=A0A9D2H2B6_9FIRM|nr:type II toxin-antitoxin system Phd/YefM family antitoxin [Candidatus Gallimonas gallistercoris]
MPTIRPSSDIRNNYQEISRLCKETGKPVYITVNGKGDTAIMDIEALDELYARLELYEKLTEGLKDLEEGRVRTHEEVFSKFRGQ